MKKVKHYRFKTIKEIADIVNTENYDNLSESFTQWLKTVAIYKKSPKFLKKMVTFDTETFGWIDDGKMDIHITIKKIVKTNHEK